MAAAAPRLVMRELIGEQGAAALNGDLSEPFSKHVEKQPVPVAADVFPTDFLNWLIRLDS